MNENDYNEALKNRPRAPRMVEEEHWTPEVGEALREVDEEIQARLRGEAPCLS